MVRIQVKVLIIRFVQVYQVPFRLVAIVQTDPCVRFSDNLELFM